MATEKLPMATALVQKHGKACERSIFEGAKEMGVVDFSVAFPGWKPDQRRHPEKSPD